MPYRNRFDFALSIPNKTVEYLSAGLPLISSLSGTVESLIHEFNCGRTYDSAGQLVRILEELSGRPDLLAHMSSNARELFARCFKAEKVYSDLADHLEALVAGRNI
jgi:glycosyltransferase involved in cell wall biosynthesis